MSHQGACIHLATFLILRKHATLFLLLWKVTTEKKLLLFIAVSFFFLKYIFKIDEKIVSVEVKTTSNATPIYRIVDSMMNELITHVILKKVRWWSRPHYYVALFKAFIRKKFRRRHDGLSCC